MASQVSTSQPLKWRLLAWPDHILKQHPMYIRYTLEISTVVSTAHQASAIREGFARPVVIQTFDDIKEAKTICAMMNEWAPNPFFDLKWRPIWNPKAQPVRRPRNQGRLK